MSKIFNNEINIHCVKSKNTNCKEKLEVKLKWVRFFYNLSKILTLNFVPAFLFAFVASMMSVVQSASQGKSLNKSLVSSIMEFLGSAFFDILLIQVSLSIVVCVLYEVMKSYKAELKRMKRAQSRPKK
ncbi:hypothetical protein ACLD5W_03630 [Gardnerella greenwoodii]|uniref:hypothetical protein n=1 Tax=Gardnerella greenwoodii TaxID=2914925 RepID=UPI003970E77F